jgi:DNA gyrase subunit B
MPGLFEREMVYIAQPPLYEIKTKGKKKSEYIVSESQMRHRMETRGLEGTKLVVRNERQTPVEVSGDGLKKLVKLLNHADRVKDVLERRGIVFRWFLENYYNGRSLPSFHVRLEGQSQFYYDKSEFEKRQAQLEAELNSGQTQQNGQKKALAEELHEVARLNEIDLALKEKYDLGLGDFLIKPAKAVSGEALPTKFEIVCQGETHKIASLGGICQAVRQIGGKGIEIKRFKGLGEMNSDQLWETTMNPKTRTLLQVKIEDAGEADRLFSILMGEDVEKRRNFIRAHALEVQNLDI